MEQTKRAERAGTGRKYDLMRRFRTAAAAVAPAGYADIADRLEAEADNLAEGTYKIAVVGEFKAGKSTLINRVFLKDDILFTDIMEATAVPTEIRYGPDRLLEVVPQRTAAQETEHPFTEGRLVRETLTGEEGEPLRIPDPSPEEIRAHTAAETSERRSELSARTARVRIHWPAENLAGLTLIDTPGINSVNEAVLATTYGIIPEADVVLFVTTARQLSNMETEFLSGRVFGEGLGRVLVVVTYDPNAGILPDPRKENLLANIRAQLAAVGREGIPAAMVNLRDPGGDPEADAHTPAPALGDRIEASDAPPAPAPGESRRKVDSVIGGLLGETSRPVREASVPSGERSRVAVGIRELEAILIDFIRENVRPGRLERAAHVLETQIDLALARCGAELSAMERTDTERREAAERLQAREAAVREEHRALAEKLTTELSRIEGDFVRGALAGLDRIMGEYLAGFDACADLGGLQDRLNRAGGLIKADVEALFFELAAAARREIEDLAARYSARGRVLFEPLEAAVGRDLSIDGGPLSHVPPFAVLALDFSVFALVGPFRPVARVLVRLLAEEIPLLNRAMPANLATAVLRRQVKNSLEKSLGRLKAELPARLKVGFQAVRDRFTAEWEAHGEERIRTLRAAVARGDQGPPDPRRRETLRRLKATLEELRPADES